MHLAWITDPHLNHVGDEVRRTWLDHVHARQLQGVVISGDIAEADDVVAQLLAIHERLDLPVYFVLGNHDFYRSSIARTRQRVIRATREQPNLIYLTDCPPIELAPAVYIVGEDGWGDATIGDYANSYVRLNDFQLIREFVTAGRPHWQQQLQQLGFESAARLAAKLNDLPLETRQVLVVTHVPPLRQACWYEGRTSDDHWAPFFVCGQVGQVLIDTARARPSCQFVVICGHTHHAGLATIAPNLQIHTGAAEYGQPRIEAIIDVVENAIRVIS